MMASFVLTLYGFISDGCQALNLSTGVLKKFFIRKPKTLLEHELELAELKRAANKDMATATASTTAKVSSSASGHGEGYSKDTPPPPPRSVFDRTVVNSFLQGETCLKGVLRTRVYVRVYQCFP